MTVILYRGFDMDDPKDTTNGRSSVQREVYTLAEMATLLGVSYTTAWNAVQTGNMPIAPFKAGRSYCFPKAAVNRLLGIDGRDAA
jgi:excisionase family DNA binding protein